jgi:molybdopterin/thiamine biosynthesis adenylyltransferase
VNRAAINKGIPSVGGAVEDFYGQAKTIVTRKTACLKWLFPEAHYEEPWPIRNATCSSIDSIEATDALKHHQGMSLLENRLLILDGLSAEINKHNVGGKSKLSNL